MPISKNTGKRYAAGSSQKYGGWEPRFCNECGRKLTLKDHAWHAYDHDTDTAWTFCQRHFASYRQLRAALIKARA